MEYLHELTHLLYGKDTPWASRMKDQWKDQMEKDQVQDVIDGMNNRVAQMENPSAETLEKSNYSGQNRRAMLVTVECGEDF